MNYRQAEFDLSTPDTPLPEGELEWLAWAQSVNLAEVGRPQRQKSARVILVYLATERVRHNLSDPEYGTCWPSIKTIASDTRRGVRLVFETLRALHDAGLLRIEARRNKDGTQRCSRYTLQPAFNAPKGKSVRSPVSSQKGKSVRSPVSSQKGKSVSLYRNTHNYNKASARAREGNIYFSPRVCPECCYARESGHASNCSHHPENLTILKNA